MASDNLPCLDADHCRVHAEALRGGIPQVEALRVARQRILGLTHPHRSLRLLGVNLHRPCRGLQLCVGVIHFFRQRREGPFPLWSSCNRQVRKGHLCPFRYDLCLFSWLARGGNRQQRRRIP